MTFFDQYLTIQYNVRMLTMLLGEKKCPALKSGARISNRGEPSGCLGQAPNPKNLKAREVAKRQSTGLFWT